MDTRTLTVDHTTSTAHRLSEYDGACNHVHGHNMRWEVELTVMVPPGDEAMAVDFKDVSGLLDQYDHAILLHKDDELVEALGGNLKDIVGDFHLFRRDPTTEHLSKKVAREFIAAFDEVKDAKVTIYETDKYGMTGKI